MTAPMSTSNPATRTPYSPAVRTSWAISALRMSALLGMQPRRGQVPPTRSRSISATLASASDARAAAFIPAMPPPITIRSTLAIPPDPTARAGPRAPRAQVDRRPPGWLSCSHHGKEVVLLHSTSGGGSS